MKYRYRCQGPFLDVHFKKGEKVKTYVSIRLWFDEDGDLKTQEENGEMSE